MKDKRRYNLEKYWLGVKMFTTKKNKVCIFTREYKDLKKLDKIKSQ